jgi:hypothetical protein
MPEAGCLVKAHLDIQSKAGIPGSSGMSADHPSEHGTLSKLCIFTFQLIYLPGLLFFHEPMLANPNGSRQSMTLHPCQLGDPDFLPLPKARGVSTTEICTTCREAVYQDEEPQVSILFYLCTSSVSLSSLQELVSKPTTGQPDPGAIAQYKAALQVTMITLTCLLQLTLFPSHYNTLVDGPLRKL